MSINKGAHQSFIPFYPPFRSKLIIRSINIYKFTHLISEENTDIQNVIGVGEAAVHWEEKVIKGKVGCW